MELSNSRLVYLGPRSGIGGVGDYAEQFVDAVRPLFGEVVEYRHGGPGDDTVVDLRRHRAAIRDLVARSPRGATVVHAELSGGAVAPFWALTGVRDTPVTAMVHDAPQLIWWPARTKFMAGHKLVNHGLHYPLRSVSRRVQRRVAGNKVLFALTDSGVASLETEYPDTRVVRVPHLTPVRSAIAAVTERPRAIGFFGLVYRGKGFEQIAEIRRMLPDDITIRIAGRGTEALPSAPGIDIVGGVDGDDEDAFFASVRAIVVPYGKRTFYGAAYPSSAVIAHAIGYGTPVICSDHGALQDLDERAGAVVLRGLAEGPDTARRFADAITSLVNDDARLAELDTHLTAERAARAPRRVAEIVGAEWSKLLVGTGA